MCDFIRQCIDRYLELTGTDKNKLKNVPTPYIDEQSLPQSDLQNKGALAADASKVLLKILFAARMGRFDLLFSVVSLARLVTRWSCVLRQTPFQADMLPTYHSGPQPDQHSGRS